MYQLLDDNRNLTSRILGLSRYSDLPLGMYVQYIGGILSTLGAIRSTFGGILEYILGVQYVGGYLEYV